MTHWHVLHGDILDLSAEGLLCSANPHLNLSGGVGGAFLLRYGGEMQTFLHDHLRQRQLRYIAPGNAVIAPACGSPYAAVAHAVAIDAFYGTNADQILAAYRAALSGLANAGCRFIAAACLGCGYGRCPTDEFLKAVRPLMASPELGVQEVTFATTNDELAEALSVAIGGASGGSRRLG